MSSASPKELATLVLNARVKPVVGLGDDRVSIQRGNWARSIDLANAVLNSMPEQTDDTPKVLKLEMEIQELRKSVREKEQEVRELRVLLDSEDQKAKAAARDRYKKALEEIATWNVANATHVRTREIAQDALYGEEKEQAVNPDEIATRDQHHFLYGDPVTYIFKLAKIEHAIKNLAVQQCPNCFALVVEDFMPRHLIVCKGVGYP